MSDTADLPAIDSPPAVREVLRKFRPRNFERGQTLIRNTYLQAEVQRSASLAYVLEGLVRGAWHRSAIAPQVRATAIVAGDRRWIGAGPSV